MRSYEPPDVFKSNDSVCVFRLEVTNMPGQQSVGLDLIPACSRFFNLKILMYYHQLFVIVDSSKLIDKLYAC